MIVMLFSLTLLLQQGNHKPQSCPVQIVKFSSHGSAVDYSYPGHATLTLSNTTDKLVVATIIKLSAIDAVGDEHEFAVTLTLSDKGKIKPGQTKKGSWTIHTPDAQKLKAWISALRFEDGTVWHDDGSHSYSKQ